MFSGDSEFALNVIKCRMDYSHSEYDFRPYQKPQKKYEKKREQTKSCFMNIRTAHPCTRDPVLQRRSHTTGPPMREDKGKPVFSSIIQNSKFFFRHLYRDLNLDEIKNTLYSLPVNRETNLMNLIRP